MGVAGGEEDEFGLVACRVEGPPSAPTAATSFVAMRAGQSRPTLQETTRGASASTSNIHSSAAVVTAAATEHTIIASFMRVSISMYALLIEQTGSIS